MKRRVVIAFAAVAGATLLASAQTARDAGSVRELVDGIRGANAVQCELIIQAFFSWTTSVPDRDVTASRITHRLRERVIAQADVTWLAEQLRGNDVCAARASARLLGRSAVPAARTLLVTGLSDANAQVRKLSAVGIGIREDTTVNGRLVTLLRDADPGVRAAAAWALGAVH